MKSPRLGREAHLVELRDEQLVVLAEGVRHAAARKHKNKGGEGVTHTHTHTHTDDGASPKEVIVERQPLLGDGEQLFRVQVFGEGLAAEEAQGEALCTHT